MAHTFFAFLASQPFVALFLVLGLGHLLGRLRIGFFTLGSTAGALTVALVVGTLALHFGGVHFAIPDLLNTFFLALFTYAIGLRVGPQFIDGLRRQGVQLVVLVMVTTTVAFIMSVWGARFLHLGPGYAPGLLSGANTISAVLGVATSAIDEGLYHLPPGMTAEAVKANLAAGYSLSYLLSMLGIVLLVRNLPSMFGFNVQESARRAEKVYGPGGHALPGTSGAFEHGMMVVDVRVFQLTNAALVGQPVTQVWKLYGTPVLRLTREGTVVPLAHDPVMELNDLLTVGGRIKDLIADPARLGPEVADDAARKLDVDQAEIVLTAKEAIGHTVAELRQLPPMYGLRLRALFRDGHELSILEGTELERHDVLRVIGPPAAVARACAGLGQAVRPTNTTDIVTLGLGIAAGYAVGLITVNVAGVPIGLGTMGGIVVAGMVVSIVRSINPALGGPMPEGARAFLESIGVDLFVCGLGLNVAPALVDALTHGLSTFYVLLLGLAIAVVPTFVSYVVGLYILKMDPIVLAGAVSGARNSTTAMRAISDRAHSDVPAFGYPVTYALSTVVFLVYGYIAMLIS
jgi:putative transport protein